MKFLTLLLLLAVSPLAHAETFSFNEEIGLTDSTLSDENLEALKQAMDEEKAAGIVDADANLKEPAMGSIKLIGRGLEDRKTHDSIAMACVGTVDPVTQEKNCNQLRNVYFEKATGKVFYTGKTYQIGMTVNADGSVASVTDADIAEQQKKMNIAFKKFRRAKNNERNRGFFLLGACVIFPAIMLGTPKVWMTTTILGSVAMPVTIAVAGVTMITYYYLLKAFVRNSTVFTSSPGGAKVMVDQNGWNWSSKPKTISNRNFETYKSFIQYNYGDRNE